MITTNPTLGPHCNQRRFDWYVRIAGELESRVPNIGPIKVWYNDQTDFVIIEFDIDGHHYYIEGYKVYTVQKDDRRNDRAYFQHDHDLINFFCGNYYHGPNSPLPVNPKYKTWQPKYEVWEQYAQPEELAKAQADPDNYKIIPKLPRT